MRRLPVYILLDCSESMAGVAVKAVAAGAEELVRELRADPYALETAHLSVITFSREARQDVPLTELMEFRLPELRVRPGTALGAALRLLKACIRREVQKTTRDRKGDYKPLVFLLSDGEPTDDWEAGWRDLREAPEAKIGRFCSIACGPMVDLAVMHAISDTVFRLKDVSGDAYRELFVWLSASVSAASSQVAEGKGFSEELPPLPEKVLEFAPKGSEAKAKRPRQLFLHARCVRTGNRYLMRFRLNTATQLFDPMESQPLDTIEGEEAAPPNRAQVDSNRLNGCPPCPYCENPGAGQCDCGTVLCFGDQVTEGTCCPNCQAVLSYGGPREFAINLSEG